MYQTLLLFFVIIVQNLLAHANVCDIDEQFFDTTHLTRAPQLNNQNAIGDDSVHFVGQRMTLSGNSNAPTATIISGDPITERALIVTGTATVDGYVGIGTTTPFTQLVVPGVAAPTLLGTTTLYNIPRSISLSGNYAYITSATGLTLLDVSQPNNILTLDTLSLGSSVSFNNGYILGNIWYILVEIIGDSSQNVLVVNNITRNTINLVNEIARLPDSIFATQTDQYILSANDTTTNNFSTLLYGTNEPASITLSSKPSYISISGSFAYVLANDPTNSLFVISLEQPLNPTITATVSLPSTPVATALQNNYAYVITSNNSATNFLVINIDNVTAPVQVGATTTSGTPTAIVVADRYAYVTTNGIGGNTLNMIDISTPTNPIVVHSIPVGANPTNLAIQGRYAYLVRQDTNNGALEIYDLGGAYLQALEAGTIAAASLTIQNDANFYETVNIRGSVTLGSGVASQGAVNIFNIAPGIPALMANTVNAPTAIFKRSSGYNTIQVGSGSTNAPAYSFIDSSSTGIDNLGGLSFIVQGAEAMNISQEGTVTVNPPTVANSTALRITGATNAPAVTITSGDTINQFGLLITGSTQITGNLELRNNGALKLYEQFGSGESSLALVAPAALSQDYTYILPDSYGTTGQFLQTDGTGTLEWATVSTGASGITDLNGLTTATQYLTTSTTTLFLIPQFDEITSATHELQLPLAHDPDVIAGLISNSEYENFIFTQTNALLQNGNTFATSVRAGSNDTQNFNLITNGADRVIIDQYGAVTINSPDGAAETTLTVSGVSNIVTMSVFGGAYIAGNTGTFNNNNVVDIGQPNALTGEDDTARQVQRVLSSITSNSFGTNDYITVHAFPASDFTAGLVSSGLYLANIRDSAKATTNNINITAIGMLNRPNSSTLDSMLLGSVLPTSVTNIFSNSTFSTMTTEQQAAANSALAAIGADTSTFLIFVIVYPSNPSTPADRCTLQMFTVG